MDEIEAAPLQVILSLVVVMVTLIILKMRRNHRAPRRWWIRPLLLLRAAAGQYENHFQFMHQEDAEIFFEYTRLSVEQFDLLMEMVGPSLEKRSIRPSLSPEFRLAVTLQFLASGKSMKNLAFDFLIGHSTVPNIISETCEKIWENLAPTYVKKPDSEQEWRLIVKQFWEIWNMPNCIGAIDGKHVNIIAPAHSNSLHYNYKHFFSNVLMAITDADLNFICVEMGAYGSQSDGGIFQSSSLSKDFDTNRMNIPPPEHLPNSNLKFPYFLVGDAAFPLKTYIMRPYGGQILSYRKKIFNYRLSKARRIVENAFAVLVARWRVIWHRLNAHPELVDKIVLACVALHNFANKTQINSENNQRYIPNNYVDHFDERGNLIPGQWRNEIKEFSSVNAMENEHGLMQNVNNLRDQLSEYFLTPPGKVPWQDDCIV